MSLSSSELTSIRNLEETWMASTAVIWRDTLSDDGIGGKTQTPVAIGTVSCDLWEVVSEGEESSFNANQDIAVNEWFITVPYDTDITESDYIIIDSQTFDIEFVPKNQSLNTALRCRARSRNI